MKDSDLRKIEEETGREPTPAEEALFENLWSEHCAYRSSRSYLGDLPSEGEEVYLGPGDDAGVLRLPDGRLLTIGIESHNHPSYVDPHNGAATGVGGIVRDTLSMGARPIALADPLRFGELDDEEGEKNRYLMEHVVEGISSYGNSIGVPVVTGDLEFDDSYAKNPLVNVACIGLAEEEELVRGAATGPGNSLVLLGSSTGRDGLGGASFASSELEEEAEEESRPNVQIGDPFTEKLLIECCREIVEEGLALSMRDLGAAGLGGAASELCHDGGVGGRIDLGSVHLREEGMTAWEIVVSESQERMLIEADPGDVEELRSVAEKYDLPLSVIGETTETGRMVAEMEAETAMDLDLDLLVEGAPPEERPEASRPAEPERRIPDFDNAEAVEAVLSSPGVASKEWVYEQYDHDVQIRSVVGPGDDAAVLRLPDGEGGLVYTAGGNGRLVEAHPERGAALVVAERCRRVAAMGGEPLGLVDCMNYGSPEEPEVMAQFADSVSGIAQAAEGLDVPVLGGNVSFYNESEETGTAVNPSPTVAVVGWMEDPGRTTRCGVEERGLPLVLAGGTDRLGGSELLSHLGGRDRVPETDVESEKELVDALPGIDAEAVKSVGRGGVATAAARMAVSGGTGVRLELEGSELFGEKGVLVATEEPGSVVDALPDAEVVGETGGPGLEGPGFSFDLEELEEMFSSVEGEMRA